MTANNDFFVHPGFGLLPASEIPLGLVSAEQIDPAFGALPDDEQERRLDSCVQWLAGWLQGRGADGIRLRLQYAYDEERLREMGFATLRGADLTLPYAPAILMRLFARPIEPRLLEVLAGPRVLFEMRDNWDSLVLIGLDDDEAASVQAELQEAWS